MARYKESKDNPLYQKFGIRSNTMYVFRKIKQYRPIVFFLASVDMVTSSVQGYFWGFFGKLVIDLVTSSASREEQLRGLVPIMIFGTLLALLICVGKTVAGAKLWPRYIDTRMCVIHERVEKALTMSYEMLERPEILDLHERATRATNSNNDGFEGMMHTLQDLGKNVITLLVSFTAVLVLDVRLIAAITALTVVSFIIYRRIIRLDKTRVWDRLMPVWRRIHYMSRVTQDFDYAKDIRLFSLKEFLLKKQRGIYAMKQACFDRHHDLWNIYSMCGFVISALTRVLVYAVLFKAVLRDTDALTLGNFTLYLSLAFAFSGALTTFLQRFGDYSRESMKVDDFRAFMAQQQEEEEGLPIPEGPYTIEFRDVSYRYLKADKDAVSHMDLTLHPGEKLAVVGLNGAGKTTMIKLLLRLYDPTSGVILLNGCDIRRFRRKEYYRLFSPVFQNVQIFAASLGENISMSPAEKTDRARVENCLREAGLSEKRNSLENGLDTELLKVVDARGVDLSGGEKQKLALARALYKDAPVVVLDEPTAALDALAEKQLYERFDSMIRERTAVYISHRLASTRFCDKIAMFVDGELREYGTHEDLIRQRGAYAEMFDVQAQYYREDHEEARAE